MGKYVYDTWVIEHKGTNVNYSTSQNTENFKVYLKLEYKGVKIDKRLEEGYLDLVLEVTNILNEIDNSTN